MADRRIIAIAVTPKAYDEIQKLKGNRTWTQYVLEGMVILHPHNQTLKDEYAAAQKESKEQKPKAEEKAKKEKKVKAEKATGEQASAEAAVEVPSAEEAERVELECGKTLIMPHTHKSKKAKVQEPSAEVTEEPIGESTGDELKAEVPTGEGAEQMGISTPPQPKKLKTLQELQAINKGGG